jgi:hypothetical protein
MTAKSNKKSSKNKIVKDEISGIAGDGFGELLGELLGVGE